MKKMETNQIAYFDCPSGISGNMVLGALIDAGLSIKYLKKELAKLKLSGYMIKTSKAKKGSLVGTHLEVILKKKEKPRNLKEILSIINKSKLSKNIKWKSKLIFTRLAKAEAKVHGEKIEKVHFHDIGAIDTIIDVVGTLIGLEKLGIQEIHSSPLHVGKGTIKYIHGTLPIPTPATAELLKGVPIYSRATKGELVTPTGAAIISTLSKGFESLPKLKVSSIGYGAGTRNLKNPNLLRIMIGEADSLYEEDSILQIETNIDDMDPKLYDKAIKNIMAAGALDAYMTPIRMKKKRHAVTLTVLADLESKNKVLKAIFNETTTLGVRIFTVKREKLVREIRKIRTKRGQIRVKIGKEGTRIKTIAPEYEDLKRIAKKYKVPVERIYSDLKKAILGALRHS